MSTFTKHKLVSIVLAFTCGGVVQAIGFAGLASLSFAILNSIKPTHSEMPGVGEVIAFVAGAITGSLGAVISATVRGRSHWWLPIGLATGLALCGGIAESGRSESTVVNVALIFAIGAAGGLLGLLTAWIGSPSGALLCRWNSPVASSKDGCEVGSEQG